MAGVFLYNYGYICVMEERYLYPGNAAKPIYSGEDYVDYWLSNVLATHGCVIRHINTGKIMEVFIYLCKDGDRVDSRVIKIPMLESIDDSIYLRRRHYISRCQHNGDLVIRYSISGEGNLSNPRWHTVYNGKSHAHSFKDSVYCLLADYLPSR